MLTLLARRTITYTSRTYTYPWRNSTRNMSSIDQFVSDVKAADPTLVGESDKDKTEIQKLSGEVEGLSKDLPALNEKLTPLTYLYSNRATLADVSLYCHLHPQLVSTPATQHPSQPSILRYFLQIQSLQSVQTAQSKNPNSFPPLDVDVSTLTTPERKVIVPPKKEKKDKKPVVAEEGTTAGGIVGAVTGAVAAAGSAVGTAAEAVKNAVVGEGEAAVPKEGGRKDKKEKKEKKEKPKVEAKVETGPMPSMIDMRVGKVLDVKKHPEADSLYVEQIDIGEAEPRTVCSGLVKYMTEDEIRGATIIVICNLKPVTMRGVKSYAMLLCASSKDGKEGGVEFVLPPAGSQPGERIYFEGEKYESVQPETQLNPKKKVFETIQPGFITLDNLDAAWVDPETKSVHKIRTKDGVCKAKSFVGASLS